MRLVFSDRCRHERLGYETPHDDADSDRIFVLSLPMVAMLEMESKLAQRLVSDVLLKTTSCEILDYLSEKLQA